MSSIRLSRTVMFFLSVLSALIQADPVRPTQGYELGDPASGIDIVVAPAMNQCDPFLVYYNVNTTSPYIAFYTPDLNGDALLTLLPPAGSSGYIDWICDIPAGHELIVAARVAGVLRMAYYTVQSGDSSACLVPLTSTYSIVNYGTNFASYTAGDQVYLPAPTGPSTLSAPIANFPASSLPTITANPDLIALATTFTTTTPQSSSSSSSPLSMSQQSTSTVSPSSTVPSPSHGSASSARSSAPAANVPPSSSTQTGGPSSTDSKKLTSKLAPALGVVVGIVVVALVFSLWRCSQRSNQVSRVSALMTTERDSTLIPNGLRSKRQPPDGWQHSTRTTTQASQSTPDTLNPRRDLAVEILASQLTEHQRRALLATLIAPQEISFPVHGEPASSSSYQDGSIQGVISPAERRTVFTTLNQLLAAEDPSGSDVDALSSQPPPYER